MFFSLENAAGSGENTAKAALFSTLYSEFLGWQNGN
jgi:hypothetical protein